jgi:hypothetical protein
MHMSRNLGKTAPTIALLTVLLALADCGHDRQVPVYSVQFQQFKLNFTAGPCQPGDDCAGFIMLDSHGTLSYDKMGELPEGTVHTTTVTQAELDAAVPILTNIGLIALLDRPGPICPEPTDVHEDMTLWTTAGTNHSHDTTGCSDQPITNARQALHDLANSYFP